MLVYNPETLDPIEAERPRDLKGWYSLLECSLIDIASMPDGSCFVVDDEGALHDGAEMNTAATIRYARAWVAAGADPDTISPLFGKVAYLTPEENEAWQSE